VHSVLVLGLGAVTAIPLLMFAAAARRLPLTYIGLTQYLAPILQFIIGVVVLHEDMPTARWLGFGLVWLALVVLTVDVFGANRRSRAATVLPAQS
jgi:chloramphenicol-sensitive protein RarD